MRNICILGASVAILGGCVSSTVPVMYKEGATKLEANRVLTNCEVYAMRTVPASVSVGQTPTFTTPLQTSCYGSAYGGFGNYLSANTNCVTTGGQTYGGDLYSYDANLELRKQVADQCAMEKGYRELMLPRCSSDVKMSDIPKSEKLPEIVESSCALEASDGNIYVYSPQ